MKLSQRLRPPPPAVEQAQFGIKQRTLLSGITFPSDLTDPANLPPSFPTTLSQTGIFKSLSGLTPANGLLEYSVKVPLWSDGAIKRRWIGVPGTSQIQFSATGAWGFPTGTILVKHFELRLSPTFVRRVETRVFINFPTVGWRGFTYRWNDLQTDGDLVADVGASDTFNLVDEQNNTTTQTWVYPKRSDCLNCHNTNSGTVLSANAFQLNHNFDYDSVTDNQLRTWNHIGLFAEDIGNPASYGSYPAVDDEGASLESRSRAYLAVNCSHCHRPGASCPMDLRYTTATVNTSAVNVLANDGLGISAYRIRSSAKETSAIFLRPNRLDGKRMPPLATSVIDAHGVDLLGKWIDSIK